MVRKREDSKSKILKKKQGVSGVIVTVLLVVLALVVVGIAWTVLSNVVGKNAGETKNISRDLLSDTDRDGLSAQQELALGTDPNKADSDGDGVIDGVEVLDETDPLNRSSYKFHGSSGSGTSGGSSSGSGLGNIILALPLQISSASLSYHSCALISDGTVKCWGAGGRGQLGDGNIISTSFSLVNVSGITKASQISVGVDGACALISDGTVKCWGGNQNGQLGDGTNVDSSVPVSVLTINNVINISSGGRHSCALISDGTVKCWGFNSRGQLGNGTQVDSSVPVSVFGINNAIGVFVGIQNSCALLSDGTVKCWGADMDFNNLVNGKPSDSFVPVDVSWLMNSVDISLGYFHSCAVFTGGNIKCLGRNMVGELGDGTLVDSFVSPVSVSGINDALKISVGFLHSCALISDGTVKCWGQNILGVLGDGTLVNSFVPVSVSTINNVLEILSGSYHSCALISDGTVKCWGNNGNAQLGNSLEGISDSFNFGNYGESIGYPVNVSDFQK